MCVAYFATAALDITDAPPFVIALISSAWVSLVLSRLGPMFPTAFAASSV